MIFVLRRSAELVFVLVAVSVLVFLSLHLVPGDPASIVAGQEATADDIAQIRSAMGLDRPLVEQYFDYMAHALRGDFGYSYQSGLSVSEAIAERLPNTMKLSIAAMIIALLWGVPIGVISAIKRKTFLDTASTTVALTGISIPNFWLGAMLILAFSVTIPIFPVAGLSYPFWTREGLLELVLPAVALGTSTGAIVARMTRSSMLEVIRSDFIRTVRAKGMSENRVVYIHALRNALIPVVTIIGLNFGGLLGGALVTEQVFAINGIGRLLVNALNARDFPIVQATVLLVSALFVVVSFLIDLMYAVIDPRVKIA